MVLLLFRAEPDESACISVSRGVFVGKQQKMPREPDESRAISVSRQPQLQAQWKEGAEGGAAARPGTAAALHPGRAAVNVEQPGLLLPGCGPSDDKPNSFDNLRVFICVISQLVISDLAVVFLFSRRKVPRVPNYTGGSKFAGFVV